MNTKNNKYLFAIDLDGTLLKNSATGLIDKKDILAIKKIIKMGHVVCIVTGRPWSSTQKTYEKLNLKTLVANYNGAQIHNPKDYSFNHTISYMNLNDVMYILGDEEIKKAMTNLAIEGPSWVMLQKRDKNLERVFGFDGANKFKLGINIHRLPLRPTGIVFDTKPGVNIKKLKDYLQRTYGDLAEFSSWSKGDGLTPVFDITAIGATKAKAISLMARYYNIPLSRTISIGDGYNDIPMFQVSEISVAMKNATDDIKENATFVSEKSNKEAGVASFINRFLSSDRDEFVKELRNIRKIKMKL